MYSTCIGAFNLLFSRNIITLFVTSSSYKAILSIVYPTCVYYTHTVIVFVCSKCVIEPLIICVFFPMLVDSPCVHVVNVTCTCIIFISLLIFALE